MEFKANLIYKDPFYNYIQSRITHICPFRNKSEHLQDNSLCSYPHYKKDVNKKSELYCIFGSYCHFEICKKKHLQTIEETDNYINFIYNFIQINKNILIEKAKFELKERLKYFKGYTLEKCDLRDNAVKIILSCQQSQSQTLI